MEEEILVCRRSPEHDPDGRKLQALMEAQLGWETARCRRALLVHLTAALGLLLWVTAAWPHLAVRRFALAGWAVAALSFVTAAVSEWRWERRRATCRRSMGGGVSEDRLR